MFIYQISLHLIRFYDNSNVASIKYQSVSYALDSKLIHDWKVDKFIEHMGCAVERGGEVERCRVFLYLDKMERRKYMRELPLAHHFAWLPIFSGFIQRNKL